jgi:hypothetical protein
MFEPFLPWKLIRSLHPRRKVNKEEEVQIPEDLEDAVGTLSTILKKSNLEILKSWPEEDAIGRTHFRIGQWMRNDWGLWGGSRLAGYFRSLGIRHGDDMSAIIVTSLHRRLNNKDIALEEQVAFYKSWWETGHRVASYADREHLRCVDQGLCLY